jgi:RIO kinase 1
VALLAGPVPGKSELVFRVMIEIGEMKPTNFEHLDKYENWETQFLLQDRSYRRQKQRRPSKQDPAVVRSEMTDFSDNATDFLPSYADSLDPLHYERQWIIRSLGSFYQDNLITDVTRIVKGGKEANVYCCTADPATGVDLIAAKLYRPRILRHLKNDALYQEGRILLDSDGKEAHGDREARAMRKKTRFGKHMGFMNWIMHEFQVHKELFNDGADVPKPIARRGNAILMAFVGTDWTPAPTLSEVAIDANEARELFERVIHNVRLMLSHHYVHGDLSAYNILYWDGEITIIDFPQMVDARKNHNANMLFQRDVRRVCQYFSRFGVKDDPVDLAGVLWESYMNGLL